MKLQLPHILSNTWCCQSFKVLFYFNHSTGVYWCYIGALTCISFNFVTSFMKCLIKSLSLFLLSCLFPINLRSSGYILDPSPLVDICNTNIFFHPVACLFHFFIFLKQKDLNFNVVQLIEPFFMVNTFSVLFKKSCLPQGHKCYFLLKAFLKRFFLISYI